MNFHKLLTPFLASILMLFCAACNRENNDVNADGTISYNLKPFDGPFSNPHKGFTVPTSGTWVFAPEQPKILPPLSPKNTTATHG